MGSYYLNIEGNDENNGLSRTTPLKTLKKAVERAKKGSIKRIEINGNLNGNTEGKNTTYAGCAFDIENTGVHEIIITGNSINETPELSGYISYYEDQYPYGNIEKCIDIIHIGNNTNIKFENIKITNGKKTEENKGIGLYISGKNCKVTLGKGVEICNNNGNGIYINNSAKLIIDGGKIYNNNANEGGGIYIRNGECIIKSGEVIENHAEYGGGIFLYYEDGFRDDIIKPIGDNKSIHKPYPPKYYRLSGNLQILDGIISKNEAVYTGGGIYISNGAYLYNKNVKIFGNLCNEELGKDIFNQNLSNTQNDKNKLQFPEDQITYLNELISECRKIPEKFNNDEVLIESNYTDYCSQKAFEILEMYKSDNSLNYNFSMLNLINKYIISFWNYIVSINEYKADTYQTLNNLIFSAIKKFGLIIQLMENEDYENGLILFRSFYENIIITEFLSFHNECIRPFEQFSFLRLKDRLPKNALEKNYNFQELFNDASSEYTKDIRKDYAWAQTVIKKNEINLSDIAETIFARNKFTNEMYKMSSELLHSNTGILNDYHFSDVLGLLLKKYMENFAMPFVLKTFLDVYHESNYFDVNVFLKIVEIILDIGYKYKLDIR